MCKRCSAYVDLQDYRITSTLSKNLRTKGRIVVEEEGCLLNTDSCAGEAVLKGKLIGKLTADSLEIHKPFQIKGTFKTGKLILPADTVLRWPEGLALRDADIAGELVANIKATGAVTLRSTAHCFGDIEARQVIIESGAVVVGRMKTGAACTMKETPLTPPGVAVAPGPGKKPVAAQVPFR
jgi:cytoskeletal protein CcmA (bactofilin family)